MPEEKEVTIYDIAKKLKISPTTVSRGLQDHPSISKKTKKRIADFVNEVGYRTNHFARNLRSRKTNTIGVIVPRLNSSFMSSVIAGIEQIANGHGYSLLIEPNLTTVNYSGFEIGQIAARHLVNHLNGTSPIDHTNTVILRSELIVRQSSLKKQ